MPAEREMWQAFIGWCNARIEERQRQLAPLEVGTAHTGHRGADTGFQWVDTTELTAQGLRNEIASLERVIAEYRHKAE
jgi:hypothetical protein